jgi:nucleoside phosphorylase
MSLDRFAAFSDACVPVAGTTACEKFAAYLRATGRGQRLLPARIALDLGLEEEDLDDIVQMAAQVGLLTPCPQVRCPHCEARLDLDELLGELERDGVATCPDGDHTIEEPGSLRSELRYRLTAEADAEVARDQASVAALPTMRAVILTALTVELAAVRDQLELTGKVGTDTIPGGQIHITGKLAGQHVKWEIACVLAEQTNTAAAASAVQAIAAFRPDVAIFVGIAGGIAENGIALGDVVAATRVIAYEGGKDGKDGLQLRPLDLASSFNLKQVAAHMLLDDAWQRRILSRELSAPTGFHGHVEPIAAGSKVVASSTSATARLIEQVAPRAVAIEMEGAGFLEAVSHFQNVSGIVVRGISDLLDGKATSDRQGWQRQASANAAAFAFELLDRFQPSGN